MYGERSQPLLALLLFLVPIASMALEPPQAILSVVPSECTDPCTKIAAGLENCVYKPCVCTNENGRELEGCMNCLYRLGSTREVRDAAQQSLKDFEQTCGSLLSLNGDLTISAVVSATPSPNPATSSATSSSIVPSPTSQSSTVFPSSSTSLSSATPASTSPVTTTGPGAQQCVLRARTGNLRSAESKSDATRILICSSITTTIFLPVFLCAILVLNML
ncbi:hypothetical protein B0H34DRAFT_132074 [Crassisporium funariophilum]|nr:hypothetical protein B0H34DRAFT_132074 [Crassisporium funariophilum]